MVFMTMIARVIDGLILTSSMDDEHVGEHHHHHLYHHLAFQQQDRELNEYKAQAKKLFKQLNESSPKRCTIETHGPYIFQYGVQMQ